MRSAAGKHAKRPILLCKCLLTRRPRSRANRSHRPPRPPAGDPAANPDHGASVEPRAAGRRAATSWPATSRVRVAHKTRGRRARRRRWPNSHRAATTWHATSSASEHKAFERARPRRPPPGAIRGSIRIYISRRVERARGSTGCGYLCAARRVCASSGCIACDGCS